MLDPAAKFARVTDSYGFQAQKTPQNYVNHKTLNGFPEIGAERKLIDDEDSGMSSPPLWRTSPQHRQNHYRCLSPSSRAQAIARGQKELMEMVSQMPEGCYELSLRDIVEKNMVDQTKEESFSREMKMNARERAEKRTNDKKLQMSRSGSVDNGGFLLKMVFPISWGSRKKKKKKKNSNNVVMNNSVRDGRVSPKPLLFDGSAKSVENEWWKNRFLEPGESESGGFSSNSGSSKSSGRSSRSSSRNSTARYTS